MKGPGAFSAIAMLCAFGAKIVFAQEPPSLIYESSADVIRSQPVFNKGTMIGFRVYPGKDREKFLCYGLRPGDLVMSGNGISTTDPENAKTVLDLIKSNAGVSLSIERDGGRLTVNAACKE